MTVIEKAPAPIYEVTCCECKSKIQYKKSEVFNCHIQCPVCGISLWADTIRPVRYEEDERNAYWVCPVCRQKVEIDWDGARELEGE